jgi:hypothetical protein
MVCIGVQALPMTSLNRVRHRSDPGVGRYQLAKFGAGSYVPDLVSSPCCGLGPLLVGVVVIGRSDPPSLLN